MQADVGGGYKDVSQSRTEPYTDKAGEDGLEGAAIYFGEIEKFRVRDLFYDISVYKTI